MLAFSAPQQERAQGISDEDVSTREVLGQAARFVAQIGPVADVVRAVCDDAERQLRSRPPS